MSGGNNGAAAATSITATASAALLDRDNRRWADSPARWIRMAGCESEDGLYLEFARRFTAPEVGGPLV